MFGKHVVVVTSMRFPSVTAAAERAGERTENENPTSVCELSLLRFPLVYWSKLVRNQEGEVVRFSSKRLYRKTT